MKRLGLLLIAGLMAALSVPAMADPPRDWRERNWRDNDRGRDRDRDRDRGRDWHSYSRYDWNRPERRGERYDAQRYYRDGRYYKPYRVDRNTRVYRGGDGRYYCRRKDGTTGLIVGAAVGGLLGNKIDNGNSSLLGTLIGAGAGGLLGREIDRGGASCR